MVGTPAGKLRAVVPPYVAPAELAPAPDVPPWATRPQGLRRSAWRLPNAVDLSADELTAAVSSAFGGFLRTGDHPVRFWNFLPGINDPLGDDQTRYMAFNAGRIAAFERYPQALFATASGVGHAGRDLWVHGLFADEPGVPVNNPRQVPPHRYSSRYGPRPPSFARATRAGDRLLVGGTASIRGEDSVHLGDLHGQVAETLTNLAAVITAAGASFALVDVRVYHRPEVNPADVQPLLPSAWRVEWVAAELCRPELLVEIEGLAERTT